MPRKVRKGVSPRVMDERAYERDVRRLFWNTYQAPLLNTVTGRYYDPERVLRDIEAIAKRVATDPDFAQEEATRAIAKINANHRAKFAKILAAAKIRGDLFAGALDASVAEALQSAIVTNVALIKGMSEGVAGFTAKNINDIIVKSPFDLHAQQQEITALLQSRGAADTYIKNRSRLITRDQNNKLIGELTQLRHKKVGGTTYLWSTSADERVRSNHKSLDGTEHHWSNAPLGGGTTPFETGHPGSGIQCRCVPDLIFENE